MKRNWLAVRLLPGELATLKKLSGILLGGCLLWSTGCCRHGLLLDFSIELNRVPWRTGCERCGCGNGGGATGGCQGACARCGRGRGGELADAGGGEGPELGRFFPVPTKPVFSQPVAAMEEVPRPQARKIRRPRPIAPEPDDREINSVAIRKANRK